jgi:RNA polymerase sigma-70 factor (ECF subfamily)
MAAASTEFFVPVQDAPRAEVRPVGARTGLPEDDGLSAFMRARPRLFAVAYRILRSAAEAEDVVQEVWLRWQMTDRSVVRDAVSFLATTTTRLSINVIQSARARREIPAGPSLPEPLDIDASPGVEVEQREALHVGLRLLLERLSPPERAGYILREAFGYAYRDIASILRLREANARQLVVRARRRVASGRRMRAAANEMGGLIGTFLAAAELGDLARLEKFFTSRAVPAAGGRSLPRPARPVGATERAPGSTEPCRYAA